MSIVLEHLNRRYANQVVVDDVSLEVADGELFVLLGSSGSGKTTVLRMVAGLSTPDSGRVILHGRDVTALPPQQRGAGFVFQNYSLFRHMTVAENIEFGLTVRRVRPAERFEKRDRLLDLVGLAGLGARYAHQLSGGQQQRVALARALAYEPSVLLLDEPFGALDVKTRVQLRRGLKSIQQRLGVTTILVTHDQEEAFELADRIAVIDRGRVLEIGAPEALYSTPKTLFVSTFLGGGTVLVGRAHGDQAHFGSLCVPIPPEVPHEDGARVQILFRPEQVAISDSQPTGSNAVIGMGKILEHSFVGMLRRVRCRLPRLPSTRQIAPVVPFGEEGLLVDANLPTEMPVSDGDVWVSLRGWHILEQPPMSLLVCDSGVDSSPILNAARVLGKGISAAVTLVGVARTQDAVERTRAALVERSKDAGLLDAHVIVRRGHAGDEIVKEQAASLYDIIMLAPKPRPKSARMPKQEGRVSARRLGTTLATVLEHARLPVLVIKGEPGDFRRILICTAAGEPGKADIKLGGRLARRLGAAVTVLHVTKDQEAGRLARAHLDDAAATMRALEVECEVRVLKAENAPEAILGQVRAGQYGLIVVGSPGPKQRSLFGAGDIIVSIINATSSPVLVVPAGAI
ncbi:MAG TPA: ATP-binding cassette domain-containing protein [Blastocatellia bacterium]|nr:ATP-binding cassette domain-containing protein [Blastocatellia bacterium]